MDENSRNNLLAAMQLFISKNATTKQDFVTFYIDNFIIILQSIVILFGNKFGCCHIQIIYDHIVTMYYGSKFVVACYARIGTLSLILDISLSCIKENGFITCK